MSRGLGDVYKRQPFERILSAFRFTDWTSYPEIKHFMTDRNAEKLTFKMFIEYLVQTPLDKYDIHWVPIYLTCKPCLVRYKMIGRTDTIKEDSEAILREIGVNRTLPIAHAQPGGNSKVKIQEFYSDFDRELLVKLYKIYKMDFLLFGYYNDEYFGLLET